MRHSRGWCQRGLTVSFEKPVARAIAWSASLRPTATRESQCSPPHAAPLPAYIKGVSEEVTRLRAGALQGSVGSDEMLHDMSHATPKCASDLRVRLRLKIGRSRARAVQHGSTAVGATELAALRRLMAGRKHDHSSPTPMPEVGDEERHDGYSNPALRRSGRRDIPREPASRAQGPGGTH